MSPQPYQLDAARIRENARVGVRWAVRAQYGGTP